LLNLIPFIDGGGALTDAYAHEDSLALLIGKSLFDRTLAAEADLALRLLRMLCLRSRHLYANLTALVSNVRQRSAYTLLQMMHAFGTPVEGGISIALKLSQGDLADMIGCSRPVLNRELRQLEREGAITTDYSCFVVTNAALLQSIAENG
jgi:CRP-like cAMP-binding protein